jgi:hypothetical protein
MITTALLTARENGYGQIYKKITAKQSVSISAVRNFDGPDHRYKTADFSTGKVSIFTDPGAFLTD